jgi:hypothetical protein
MSYYEEGMLGLGSLAAGVALPLGQQLVAGYNVQSSAPAAQKLQAVRDAMAYGFRGTILGAGWGGPGAPGGVPAGQIWIKVQIAASGITSDVMNTVFSNVGRNIQTRLPAGSTVTNTYASTIGSAPSGATTPTTTTDPVTGLITAFGVPPTTPGVSTGIDPATGLPYGTMLPAPDNFFTQSVGGIPMWGLLAGGTVAVGAVAYVLMSGKKTAPSAAVKANRRRRSRRNRRRSR